MDIEKILNKRSNDVVTDGGVETPKKPSSSQLDNGEIAINYHKGTERIFIKNDNEQVVEFVSKDEIDKKVDKVTGKGLSTNDYTNVDKNKLSALPTNAVLTETLSGIDERLEDTEEALTDNIPLESFVMDDYSIGSETITGTNISSNGTVPIKNCSLPYISGNTITIDGVTYSKAIRKDSVPYTDGILAQFDFEERGIATVYYGFGGGGSRSDYYLQFIFSSDDSTILNKTLATRSVYDTGYEISKIALDIEKKGILTIKAIEEDWDGDYSDNGRNTNIVRIDFKATPLINVGDLKDSLATVATSGSYNDLSDKPTIPDITGKADKVSGATNGNFAALDSNGNLIDSGHKHSDYLTSHQDLSNYVQKSNTQGLLKNDGTVDTTQYLSQHQDISGKEDITPIEAVASGTTAITAQVNKYYDVAGTVSSLTVTLPTPTINTEVTMVVVHLTVGASPTVVVTSSATVAYSAAYAVVANKEYELSCLYNGSKWIVSSMEVAV